MRRIFLLAVLAAALVPVVTAAAATHSKPCSSKGLRYSYKSGGVTYSTKVTGLRANGVTCRTARQVAGVVAGKLLRSNKVLHKIRGLTVHLSNPCSGCAPNWQVRATRGGARVTFRVLGGA